mmetsp:Transcript_22371/g.64156  ORF Transcript_22371/g.64156 Transcript_22371/m.64156 type:complete len:281 (-) Transcript_22371:145-987(-)
MHDAVQGRPGQWLGCTEHLHPRAGRAANAGPGREAPREVATKGRRFCHPPLPHAPGSRPAAAAARKTSNHGRRHRRGASICASALTGVGAADAAITALQRRRGGLHVAGAGIGQQGEAAGLAGRRGPASAATLGLPVEALSRRLCCCWPLHAGRAMHANAGSAGKRGQNGRTAVLRTHLLDGGACRHSRGRGVAASDRRSPERTIEVDCDADRRQASRRQAGCIDAGSAPASPELRSRLFRECSLRSAMYLGHSWVCLAWYPSVHHFRLPLRGDVNRRHA